MTTQFLRIRIGSAGLSRALLATMLLGACAALHAAEAARPPEADVATRDQIERRIQAAKQRLDQAARELADLSISLSDGAGQQVRRITRTVEQRAMLGMAIDMGERGATAGEGVRVINVSPGGAAEAAGIKANDVVVSLNGKALKGDANQSAAQQLLDITRAAKAGESMPVEYRRDGKLVKTQIVPKSLSESFFDLRLPDLPALMGPGDGPGARVFRFQNRDGGFGGAELVELSPALGAYFGAEKGLLVVRAPPDQRFKLQDGDVILDVDGRVPTGVSHAFQILESYRAGETVKLHILRQKKRVELAVEVPAPANRPAARQEPPPPRTPDST